MSNRVHSLPKMKPLPHSVNGARGGQEHSAPSAAGGFAGRASPQVLNGARAGQGHSGAPSAVGGVGGRASPQGLGSGTPATPEAGTECDEAIDRVPSLLPNVRQTSRLTEDIYDSDADNSLTGQGLTSMRFGGRARVPLVELSQQPGDPHIEMSLTITPLPCLVPPPEVAHKEGDAQLSEKEHRERERAKRRLQIEAFNRHIKLPPETLFPEDSVGETSGTIHVMENMLEFLDEGTQQGTSQRGNPEWKAFFESISDTVELSLSPPARITLSEHDRRKAGIPEEAVFYSFSYPVPPKKTGGSMDGVRVNEDYKGINGTLLYTWLTVGAFVYFEDFSPARQALLEKSDTAKGNTHLGAGMNSLVRHNSRPQQSVEKIEKHSIVAVNCVSRITKGVDKNASLYFGKFLNMPDTATAELNKETVPVGGQQDEGTRVGGKRWHKITQSDLTKKRHYTDFAWVLPSERLGEDSFFYSRDGGFAYKCESGKAEYYPVLHAQSQLMIAQYLRKGRIDDESKYDIPDEQRGALKELIQLQKSLPLNIRKEYVAEAKATRETNKGDTVWTVYKIYRLNPKGDAVRSDFKEVYRLKIWDKRQKWNVLRNKVQEEAKLMITIQNPVHHASHALLHEYEIKDKGAAEDEDDKEAPFYFKMSHIEGQTLAHAVKLGEKFSDVEVARAATHVLHGLSEVHRHNFIHTDINAGNVMRVRSLQGYNHVILDVGLSRKGDINKKIPNDLNHMVRQVDYIAPELFDKKFHKWGGKKGYEMETDMRSDLWSVGVLMYFLLARRDQTTEQLTREAEISVMKKQGSLNRDVGQVTESRHVGRRTGMLPFSHDDSGQKRDDTDVREEICDMLKAPPRVDERVPKDDRPQINTTLLEVIFKAMSKEPDNRYNDAMEMASKIETALSSKQLPEYTIFISYRVSTDAGLAQILFDELNNATTPKGHRVTVFLDRLRLQVGENWEEGFFKGLTKSRIFMPLLSYGFTGPLAYISTRSSLGSFWGNWGKPDPNIEPNPAAKVRLQPRSNRAFLGKWWGWHDAEDNCLKELQLAERLIKCQNNRDHKTTAILPVFCGRQGPGGTIMDFHHDLSSGAGGVFSQHASNKTKKKVQRFLNENNIDTSLAEMSKDTDWSIRSTVYRFYNIQGVELHKNQPKKLNELQFVEKALDRQRQVSETAMQNRSHKMPGNTLTITVTVKVPLYPSVALVDKDRAHQIWIQDLVVKNVKELTEGSEVNSVLIRKKDEEPLQDHKKQIQMLRVTVHGIIPYGAPARVVSAVEAALTVESINSMMKESGLYLCPRQQAQSKKTLKALKAPPSKLNHPIKTTDGLLPITPTDQDGKNYKDELQRKLDAQFQQGQKGLEDRVEFRVSVVQRKETAASLFSIPVDVRSNAQTKFKGTREADLAKQLANLGLTGASVTITKASGDSHTRKDPENEKINWEKTLGETGPLNDDQLNILRKAVQNSRAQILEFIDNQRPHKEIKPSLQEKIHGWIPYIVAVILVTLLVVVLALRLGSCPANQFKQFDFICRSCPEGEGTGGRVGATMCRPSCWDWRDSQGRSCEEYESEPEFCETASLFRDLNGVDANQACYACMPDRRIVRGCNASSLPVQGITDDSGVLGNPIALAPSPDNKTIYMSDSRANRIVSLGVADHTNPTVVCGGGSASGGPGSKASGHIDHVDPDVARFRGPQGLAVDPWRQKLYVADTGNHAIREVDLNGFSVDTLAGGGQGGGAFGNKDGTGKDALFHSPAGVAFAEGIVYVSDTRNHIIRKVLASTGQVTTLAGMGTPGFQDVAAGASSSAMFYSPTGIAVTNFGTLIVADTENNVIRSLDLVSGAVETLAGSGYGSQDGKGGSAQFQFPRGLSLSPDGNFAYVAGNSVLGRISKVDLKNKEVTTIAGDPQRAPFSQFDHPTDVQAVVLGDMQYIYVAEGESSLKAQSGYATLRVIVNPADTIAPEKAALLIIDVQDCFLNTNTRSGLPGSLAVSDSYPIVPVINSLKENSCLFDLVVKTADYHPQNHTSFAAAHGVPPLYNGADGGITLTCTRSSGGSMSEASCCPKWNASGNSFECPDRANGCPVQGTASDPNHNPSCTLCKNMPELCFEMKQMMWPTHCLQKNSDGSDGDWQFAEGLESFSEDDGTLNEVVVNIGKYPYIDSYSAFMDNTKQLRTELDNVLKAQGITTLYLTGLATDFTVGWTAEDAINLGYKVKLITDGVKGLYLNTNLGTYKEQNDAKLASFASLGVELVNSSDVLKLRCNNTVLPTGDPDLDDDLSRGPTGPRGSAFATAAPSRYLPQIAAIVSLSLTIMARI